MKKLIKLTLVATLLMGASSVFAQKFGRINSSVLIQSMPETTKMQEDLTKVQDDHRANLEQIIVEFNKMIEEFNQQQATMTEVQKQSKQTELEAVRTRYAEYEQMAGEDMNTKQEEMLRPILEKAQAAINKVSQSGGYLVVFDEAAGSMIYFDEAALTDITPDVRRELGI